MRNSRINPRHAVMTLSRAVAGDARPVNRKKETMTELKQAIVEHRRAWETMVEINNHIYTLLLEAYPAGARVQCGKEEYTVQDHDYSEDGGPGILLLQDQYGRPTFVDVGDELPRKLGDE